MEKVPQSQQVLKYGKICFLCINIKTCSKHVLSEDTVQREVKSGRLFTKRLLSKTNNIPKWAERFITAKHVHIIEESIVDPKNKMLITYTRNLGYAKVMVSFLKKILELYSY